MSLFRPLRLRPSRRVAPVLALSALLAVGSAVQASAATATNGGFESDLSGWAPMAGSAVAVTQAAPHGGAKAAAVTRKSSSGPAGITDSPHQFSGLAAGATCSAQAWVKGPSGSRVTVRWVALDGTKRVLTRSVSMTLSTSWQQTSKALLTMPTTASTAGLEIVAPSFPVGATWYLDDVDASCEAGQSPPPPTSGVAAHWGFNESGTPSTAKDDSGNGNNGAVFNIRGDGRAYTFNGTDSRVVVKDSSTLDPGNADFRFGVTLSMDAPPMVGETYDVLRKGLSTTAGGDYKLEMERVNGAAYARCLVKDGQKVAAFVRAGTDLADGREHTVECRRARNSVSVVVDGAVKGTKTVSSLGSVSNASDLAIGAKAEGTAKTGFDWYLGTVSDAFVRMG
jgi:hypothetical protein